MPFFSNQPPDDPRGHALQLLRTPAGRALTAIVTSHDLIGAPTHFWGGRTVPHEQDDCKACLEGVPWRWHSWLSAWNASNHTHFLFESTLRVTKIFVAYRNAYDTLRGCKFRARRRTPAPNARVQLECQPADLEGLKLPQPPDLIKCMSIIWNIPIPDIDIQGILHSTPQVVIDRDGNGELLTGEGQLFKQTDENGPDHPAVHGLPRNR